jgi:hypothetical protein
VRFADTDINPYIEHLDKTQHFLREENYMTTTITEQAVQRPTLDTPEGTVIRLTDNTMMNAPIGALAVVSDGSGLLDPDGRFLDVRWIKDQGNQNDGGYPAHVFEIHEFQVGDAVEVVGLTPENGYTGIIETIPAHNNDDCIVAVEDNGLSLSYKFSSLKEIEKFVSDFPEQDDLDDDHDEEPLADWELELLSTPNTEPKAGDVVVIDAGPEFAKWNGLRFRLKDADPNWMPDLENGTIDSRPDGHKGDFFWDFDKLRAFDATRDFRLGDTVESAKYAESWQVDKVRGTVVNLDRHLGGDIEVDWTEGPQRLTQLHAVGAFRKHLTLVGGSALVPTIEGFGFEVDQEIGSSDVLGDLPVGTTLIVNGDEASPVITLDKGRFGRLNRYGLQAEDEWSARAYFEQQAVVWAADSDEASLVIGYLPSDS